MAGKGDTPRPVDGPKYRENFDAIFLPKKSLRDALRVRQMATDDHTPSAVHTGSSNNGRRP